MIFLIVLAVCFSSQLSILLLYFNNAHAQKRGPYTFSVTRD